LALLADLQRTVYPYKWLPVSCRSKGGRKGGEDESVGRERGEEGKGNGGRKGEEKGERGEKGPIGPRKKILAPPLASGLRPRVRGFAQFVL